MHTGMDSVYNFLQGHGSLKPSWRMESQPYITPAGITIVFGAQYSFENVISATTGMDIMKDSWWNPADLLVLGFSTLEI